MSQLVPPVVLKASKKHTATLVFLHGLGDTGFGWAGALNTIRPDFLKVICPTAPNLPVTINGGMEMPAWYDIISLDERDGAREDMEGVDWAVNYLHSLVKGEEEQGLPSDRIMIGGFSQGGAVALSAALKYPATLGGCIALSCYLPGGGNPSVSIQGLETPILQAHGDSDEVVSYKRGQLTAEVVERLAKRHKMITYPGMGHEGTLEELEDIKQFILSEMS